MATTKDLGHHMNDYYHHHLLEETLGGTQTTTGINFQCLLALCWVGHGGRKGHADMELGKYP